MSIIRRVCFVLLIMILLATSNELLFTAFAQESKLTLRAPLDSKKENLENSLPTPVEIKKLPNFPELTGESSANSAHKLIAKSTSIPIDTRLRLIVDNYIDATQAMVGDYFKAHILEDFYIPVEPPQLIVPRGSWIRGRISFVKKPSIFSMAGKIGLHLNQLVTPFGDVTLLDAELDVQQGIVNEQGLLDPMTNFGTKAIEPTQNLLDTSQGKLVSIATLGTPVVGALVAGSLIALFSQGDNITLTKGQELQVILKKDIQLNLN